MGIKVNIIRMSGGLERQMFQYAFYLKLLSLGREVKFDDINEYRDELTRPIMLSVFDIDYPRATWDEITAFTDQSRNFRDRVRRLFGRVHRKVVKENALYDPSVMEQDNVYIDGKFMSQKYFEDILPEVRKVYTFPNIENLSLPPKANENFLIYYDEIMRCDSVGIHIRRSDSRYNEELYKDICTIEYYSSAVKYIVERYPDAKFFVFSNEPKWIKGWLKDIVMTQISESMTKDEMIELRNKFVLVEANDEYTSYLDMFLLSKCKHNILSNSTFSWWGGWINENPDKIEIAPSPWLNGVDCTDIYTEGMILINSKGRVEKKVK